MYNNVKIAYVPYCDIFYKPRTYLPFKPPYDAENNSQIIFKHGPYDNETWVYEINNFGNKFYCVIIERYYVALIPDKFDPKWLPFIRHFDKVIFSSDKDEILKYNDISDKLTELAAKVNSDGLKIFVDELRRHLVGESLDFLARAL
jgi:hypothetical protein